MYSDYIRVNSEIPKSFKFPGGEISINVAHIPAWADTQVTAFLKNSDAIMELLLVTDALARIGVDISKATLEIPYFPYARQDRACNDGEALSLKVMADLINPLGYGRVSVFDPHSDVTSALINNLYIYKQEYFARSCGKDINTVNLVVVAPDAGAEKKARSIANSLNVPLVTATKNRNTATGEIVGTYISGQVTTPNPHHFIVDDICDGGRTFVELAKTLRNHNPSEISLFVTHGIFSKGFDVFKGLIDTVFYTNSLNQAPTLPSTHIFRKDITNEN